MLKCTCKCIFIVEKPGKLDCFFRTSTSSEFSMGSSTNVIDQPSIIDYDAYIGCRGVVDVCLCLLIDLLLIGIRYVYNKRLKRHYFDNGLLTFQ